jgi:hypothetical protein
MTSSRKTKDRSLLKSRSASGGPSGGTRQAKRPSTGRAGPSNAVGIWAILISLIWLAIGLSSSFSGATDARRDTSVARIFFVLVSADQGWQDTGIAAQSGQEISIEFLGGQISDGPTTIVDGTGSYYVCGNAGCCEPLPEAHRGSLIGRVGPTDESTFYIGDDLEQTIHRAGNLFLRINDCDAGLWDNHGAFQVRVTIQ